MLQAASLRRMSCGVTITQPWKQMHGSLAIGPAIRVTTGVGV